MVEASDVGPTIVTGRVESNVPTVRRGRLSRPNPHSA